ncbi:MAG: bifunctional DNA-formamidopyrimidine glycosylase/DNA-(apurinic or apyrimidinic site) lyase [Deltaproteobacteria bacterium]|nr:bifunctional DNA-formamidopyrimidine glycosylase/DNA-(apurinic or apyrimidinic site) lyase [Deltaproteobacteria bacterium]
MPELPEVDTLVRELKPHVIGKTIHKVIIYRSLPILPLKPGKFIQSVESKIIVDLTRRAKYLIFHLKPELYLLTHLRMTGKFLLKNHLKLPGKYHRLWFHLGKQKLLVFEDVRCLGKMELATKVTISQKLSRLGAEPLSKKLNISYFHKRCNETIRPIKAVLMDQSKIAGIGNIYASEILFKAGIHPERQAKFLNPLERKQIIQTIKLILKKAIQLQGTTVSDFRRVDDKSGRFQNFLNVYGKAGQPCPKCAQLIQRIVQYQRSTFFCPHCQH